MKILALLLLASLSASAQKKATTPLSYIAGDTSRYIVISDADSIAWQGVRHGVNVFYCRRTNLGVLVVDDNTISDFPDAFAGKVLEYTVLTPDDFPSPAIGQ